MEKLALRYTPLVELDAGAEIVAYDSATHKVFVTNSENQTLDVLNSSSGNAIANLVVTSYGSPNSVAAYNGLVAVAVEDKIPQAPGNVVFFNASTGANLGKVSVGVIPDMPTITDPENPFSLYFLVNEFDVGPEGLTFASAEVTTKIHPPKLLLGGALRETQCPLIG